MAFSGMRAKRLKGQDGHLQQIDERGHLPRLVGTTLFISNLHCPSCVSSIESTLFALSPRPLVVSPSIVSHSVTVSHYSTLSVQAIVEALEVAGFDIHSAFQRQDDSDPHQILPDRTLGGDWEDSLEQAVTKWRQTWRLSKGKEKDYEDFVEAMGKRAKHAEHCAECQTELKGVGTEPFPLRPVPSSRELRETKWPIVPLYEVPMTADSRTLYESELEEITRKYIHSSSDFTYEKEKLGVLIESHNANKLYQVELAIVGMTCSACVGSITSAIEALPWVRSVDVALLTNSAKVVFEGKQHAEEIVTTIEESGFDATLESMEELKEKRKSRRQSQLLSDTWKASYAIGGMTCSACTNAVTGAVKNLSYVESVDINLISNSGAVIFKGKDNLSAITEAIEDAGFDANLDNIVNVAAELEAEVTDRVVFIRIGGMYCHHCPTKLLGALDDQYLKKLEIEKAPTLQDPILQLRYIAAPPEFTIRTILATIKEIDPAFEPTIYHPPTIEDKSRELHARERRRVLFRLALAVTTAIPTFIIGVVCMSLLSANNPATVFIMAPMWAGTVSRAQWALFILATPVYFFAADAFHRKAIKELKALWRPGSRTPIVKRFTRFGSMNMLMSLGTTIAYFSSIAELIMAATEKPVPGMDYSKQNSSFYFDSVVFLTMFLLIGRFLEAYSKAKTGDAVTQLGNLRPTEAMLVDQTAAAGRNVAIDLLDVGDVVRVTHGASPPFDGVILDGETSFDESSLTGESRLVAKKPGDTVFSGTVNKGSPISIRLTSVSGTSMLDQIIKVVREGQTRRAPVERAADMITSHFVPFVVAVGITTWIVWLALGESGVLPLDWLDINEGGWPLWSLKFAIAVFVVACPCGIGLAAPTALFVGGGMAAKHGILVKGGGEAFQEASTLDCIVFDKTGTLTQGGEPEVTDYMPCSDDEEGEVLGMAMALEEQSGHPVATAVFKFCQDKKSLPLEPASVEEIPGMGMKGTFTLDANTDWSIDVDVIIGNERLMADNNVNIGPDSWAKLQSWKKQGKSVVLVALHARNPLASKKDGENDVAVKQPSSPWTLSAIFAIADALRPEAASTVKALQSRGVSVWMLSGDNPTTAQAVAAQVGIHEENVIAGVLPDQKADKIQYLQKTLPFRGRGKKHATVAMVGDGINDSPALTMADVGIAIGSGSDVAISSADFILISSNLTCLLTLIDLSRAVFRRVWFNFGWALVYNVFMMPVAAGVLYPVKSGSEGHVRLDPVWASLAMAMSSVSVVTSSLLLRSRIPMIGFRETVWDDKPQERQQLRL